jgi:hypothetical protein
VTAHDLDDALNLVKADMFPGRDLPAVKNVTAGVSRGLGAWAGASPPAASSARGVWYPRRPEVTKPYPAVFEAELRVLSAAEGGRRPAIGSGYRSLIRMDGTNQDFGMELDCTTDVQPGEIGPVVVTVWAGALFPPIQPGEGFEIREGPKVVARGTTRHYVK